MSGPLKQSRVWFALALALAMMPGLFLSACEDLSVSGLNPEPVDLLSEDAEPELVDGFVQVLDPAYIISGCWRPVGADGLSSSGGEFPIIQVEPNAFTFRKSTRTKLVVNEAGSFEEVNFDPEKPFFPPKYVHSVGQISPDGSRITRKLNGATSSVSYRRCELTIIQPLPEEGALGGGTAVVKKTAEPIPLVTPLVLPDGRPTLTPVAPTPAFSMAPTVQPSSFLPPVPTPTPTPTPRPTPTPLPSVTPLALPSSDFSVAPTASPTGEP